MRAGKIDTVDRWRSRPQLLGFEPVDQPARRSVGCNSIRPQSCRQDPAPASEYHQTFSGRPSGLRKLCDSCFRSSTILSALMAKAYREALRSPISKCSLHIFPGPGQARCLSLSIALEVFGEISGCADAVCGKDQVL